MKYAKLWGHTYVSSDLIIFSKYWADISGDEDKLEMAVHGQLSAFNSTEDDWQSYTERLEFYFTANNIEDAEKRRAILLSVCGAATYKRIKSLISPSKPTEKSFDKIVQLMSDHYNPKPTATVQRCLFQCTITEARRICCKVCGRTQRTCRVL